MNPQTHRTAIDTRTAAFVLGMNETGLTAVRCLGRERDNRKRVRYRG